MGGRYGHSFGCFGAMFYWILARACKFSSAIKLGTALQRYSGPVRGCFASFWVIRESSGLFLIDGAARSIWRSIVMLR